MIYVHIPFCRSFCTYCGFYSEKGCPGKDFVDELCAEACARRCETAAAAAVDTLYFGGGTPSVLPLSDIGRIADACGGRHWREWTVEVNPDDVTDGFAAGLRELGVNRVSMGVQSLDDGMLRWMNRRHTADGARQAFRRLRRAGFENISVDVIFGVSGMGTEMLESTVREIISWRPEHISAYQLSIDDGSALCRLCREGRYTELPDEECSRQYYRVCSALAAAGYEHYEISNWALPGRRAVHNSAYWTRAPYVGLGPGAHSLKNGNYRSWNSEVLSGWTSKGENLTEREIWEEQVMLGLRTGDGAPASLLSGAPASLLSGAPASLLSSAPASLLSDAPAESGPASPEYNPDRQNYLALLVPSAVPGHLRIPEDRWFTADDIISGIM